MAQTPGGGRSPSTQPPPAPPPTGQHRPGRDQRVAAPATKRGAIAVVRWGLLLGGLVIVADLAAMALLQRTNIPEDRNTIQALDDIANFVLFSVLGIVVVRDTRLMYLGVVAGAFAALLDATVVAAARVMAPIAGVSAPIEDVFITNLLLGVVFAGASGIVYALVQRSAGGRRPR